jgi:hypothetical protein
MLEQDLNILSSKQIIKLRSKIVLNLKYVSILSSAKKRIDFKKENENLLNRINNLRREKKKESLKIFYSLPKETRGKKWHVYIKYNENK